MTHVSICSCVIFILGSLSGKCKNSNSLNLGLVSLENVAQALFSKCLNLDFLLRLSDRNSFLENSLGEREQKLVSTTEKLEQIETLRKLLQEKDVLNKELGEKFVHAEQKVS